MHSEHTNPKPMILILILKGFPLQGLFICKVGWYFSHFRHAGHIYVPQICKVTFRTTFSFPQSPWKVRTNSLSSSYSLLTMLFSTTSYQLHYTPEALHAHLGRHINHLCHEGWSICLGASTCCTIGLYLLFWISTHYYYPPRLVGPRPRVVGTHPRSNPALAWRPKLYFDGNGSFNYPGWTSPDSRFTDWCSRWSLNRWHNSAPTFCPGVSCTHSLPMTP